MGCSQSKRVEATVVEDVYVPAPTSFAIFDINAIDEPWVKLAAADEPFKPKALPDPVLQKLDKWDLDADDAAPNLSWSEVSKALEDLKPTLDKLPLITPLPPARPPAPVKKSGSTRSDAVNQLDAKLAWKADVDATKVDMRVTTPFKSLSENSFILRDKVERERDGKPWKFGSRRDIVAGFPHICPPGGADKVVLYTTSLRGVRRTFDDCQKVRQMLEVLGVAVDERDVALHGGYLQELRELVGEEEAVVPRLFVKGRYVGGAEEVSEMNEVGRLRWVMDAAGRGKGEGRKGCEGCGGARFVPCLECNGSCKVVGEDGQGWERCGECNENGLAQCPLCL